MADTQALCPLVEYQRSLYATQALLPVLCYSNNGYLINKQVMILML